MCRTEYDSVRVSTMQRRFALGYVGASRLIEELIKRGVILDRVGNSIEYAVAKEAHRE